MDLTKSYEIIKIKDGKKVKLEDLVVVEYPLSIQLGEKEITTLYCSPRSLRALVIGYLQSEGYIDSMADIKSLEIDESRSLAQLEVYQEKDPLQIGSKRQAFQKIGKQMPIREEALLAFMKGFSKNSETFESTGGVHSCGLYDYEGMILFEDDIGRHNAYDKIFGRALEDGIELRDKMILTSGRISSEMLVKAARRQIPMIVSKSAPMSLAIEMAQELGITLIGFVRGDRMNIYTNLSNTKE